MILICSNLHICVAVRNILVRYHSGANTHISFLFPGLMLKYNLNSFPIINNNGEKKIIDFQIVNMVLFGNLLGLKENIFSCDFFNELPRPFTAG